LSGGEAQRLKLAGFLAEAAKSARQSRQSLARKGTLFLFDEPTTGLHLEDVRILLGVFQRLVDQGHSVVLIEHHVELLRCMDWLIDLGPESGDEGGRIVAAGPPHHVASVPESRTGPFLRGSVSAEPRERALRPSRRRILPDAKASNPSA